MPDFAGRLPEPVGVGEVGEPEPSLVAVPHLVHRGVRGGELPLVECVTAQINQVFMNLLLNAMGAIPDRGAIRLRTEREGDHSVRISIRDSGRGIPAEKLSRLFDPTFHAHGPRVGAGLGLSICHQIVQDHRGQILVESSPGQGSTFTVVLPIRAVATAVTERRSRPRGERGRCPGSDTLGAGGGGLPGQGLPGQGLPGLGGAKLPGLGGGFPGLPGLPKKK